MGSSAVSSARSLLELTWASNEGMTCGGWAPSEPTLARPTWGIDQPGLVANRTQPLLSGCHVNPLSSYGCTGLS